MKNCIAISCAVLLGLGSAAAMADDDISREEAARLVEQGTIQSLESLEQRPCRSSPVPSPIAIWSVTMVAMSTSWISAPMMVPTGTSP